MSDIVGVFDSGIGGLSVLSELEKLLPNEEFYYYGDSLNNPYGEKSDEELFEITSGVVDYLVNKGCRLIVIACNTATTRCMKYLREKYKDIIFVGTVPAIKVACDRDFKNTLVMATPVTIESERTMELIRDNIRKDQNIYLVACPGLANAIEDNDQEKIEAILKDTFREYKDKEIELRYIESRPFFHLKNIEGKNVINFKSLKQEGTVLINVKVFYFGFNARLLHIDELHDMSCGKNDTGIENYIVLDQEKYSLSQFIAVKATTIYNESVYFVNDCFEQRGYNFIKEVNKNKSTLVQFKNIIGDIIGEEKFNEKIGSIIKYLDDNYDLSAYRNQTLLNDIKQAMIKLQEKNINDVSLVITLIKNYRKDIKDDEVIGLLESVKNILIYTDEVTDKEVPAKEYGYFMGNLICTEEFRNKYSKKFENAMTNKVDSKHIMIDYLNDYIDECISAKFHGEEINKDYPLRNLEKYFSDYVESVTKIDNTEIMRHMESLLDRVEKEK